ncbi:DNA polymerase/3'-5' exonuclease PolX [Caminibacter mediatlanticus]|uniref:DNA-directed DNA polymerase n=1 Tax=Caminibacter mediatlanticus TB-2 TaxID=391592 RepID=A0AAI9F1R1_9BACT|nr:DNA polymerase/3'-5' exonuclease PolX [Caminibacter mediatlanticus]EDM23014.1 DNA polymerase X family/PHP domain protein [Caminibacter mediatlanticus TB-2]
MITNKEIASILSKTADLLEIKGENPFKVRAYRNAARIVENSSKDFNKLVKEGFDLTRLPGIGKDLSLFIKEIVETGKFHKLEELQKEIPPGLVDMLSIEGLGPKRIRQIYDAFKVTSLDELKKYAESGELDKLPGFGPKLIEKILKGVKQIKKAGIRFLWADVEEIAEDIRKYLLKFRGVEIVEIAGSYRRKKETVGDLDILVVAEDYPKVSEYFIKYKRVKEVHSAGLTRSTVFLDNDLQVDLRAVSKESYGAALHYFTGSKAHNIEIRKLAIEKGLKVNEYGVYRGDERIAGKSEEEVYKAVGLCFIEPELRENRGEIEACLNNYLPKLIRKEDILGDFHMHTIYSDGANSIEEMVKKAINLNYKYITITDHSKRLKVANGMSEEELLSQLKEIDEIQKKYKEIKILKGAEVDILEDGSLDFRDEILEKLDIIVGAIHYKFEGDQTKRILKALEKIDILAHPTNRIINKRSEINANFEEIFHKAKEKNVILEINSQPDRLDLPDTYIKMAKEIGCKFAINSDAHNCNMLEYIKYGINQARRGWLEKEDVVNSWKLEDVIKFLKIH